MSHRLGLAVLLCALFIVGCDDDPTGPEFEDPELTLVEDLSADPPITIGPMGPQGTGAYTLYSLRENRVVEDSASTAWDIGFQATNIIVNGGTSGPGEGAAVLLEEAFSAVTEAPADAMFRVAGSAACPEGQPSRAICPGSGNGWYTYDFMTNRITPIPGRTLVVRTADGETYAKVRILSYYRGNPPVDEIDEDSESRYYTFEYLHQPDGSKTLVE